MMKTKKLYLAKNIRAGYSIEHAQHYFAQKGSDLTNLQMTIYTYSYGRDVCGNGTTHYICYIEDSHGNRFDVVESGRRREQVGYSGVNDAATYALDCLGYRLDLSKAGSYDYQYTKAYPITNMKSKELTDA